MTTDAEELFVRALDSEDDAYLRAEGRLRDAPGVADVSESNLSHDDPVGRLMAHVMLDWTESAGDEFGQVLRYLDRAERWFAGSVLGSPPVGALVENLGSVFGGRLAEFLALRLVKVPSTPVWRARVSLGYLAEHPTPAATDALIRYATATGLPLLQAAAARAIGATRDPVLARKLDAERERLARSGRTLPLALTALIA